MNDRFEIVEKETLSFMMEGRVLRDTVTGVLYLFVQNGYAGGLTPLLDANGKPLTSLE